MAAQVREGRSLEREIAAAAAESSEPLPLVRALGTWPRTLPGASAAEEQFEHLLRSIIRGLPPA